MAIEKAGVCVEVKDMGGRTLEFIGSNEIMDRDREVIMADGWDLTNYRKNPVVLFGHDYWSPAVAKAEKVWVENGQLRFTVKFPEMEDYGFADTLYKLYKGGFMRATSVGFIPREWKWGDKDDEPRRTFTKQELLELSLVPVPANPDAVVVQNAMKAAADRGVVSDPEINELVHMLKAAAERGGRQAVEQEEKGRETAKPGQGTQDKAGEGKDTPLAPDTLQGPEIAPKTGEIKFACEICGKELPKTCPQCAAEAKPKNYFDLLLQDLRAEKEPQGETDEDLLISTLKTIKENENA